MKWVFYNACCLQSALHLFWTKTQINPINQVRYKLGVRGKTKEGYDCYVHYDNGCIPVKSEPEVKADIKAPAEPFCHPYDPNCGKFTSRSGAGAPKSREDGVILPDPDCDPEYDYNCRLRRAEPAVAEKEAADEPAKEATATQSQVPHFEDFLRGVMSKYK